MLRQELIDDAMRRALALARRGPAGDRNPQVGCAILDPEGRIVAEGWHRGAGTPHAEVDALDRLPPEWRDRAAELTAVVTLEPCNHTGRTGPCAVALADAGVGAVFFAIDDPDEHAAGGADTLRAAGVRVRGGVLADEARALLSDWLRRHTGPGCVDDDAEGVRTEGIDAEEIDADGIDADGIDANGVDGLGTAAIDASRAETLPRITAKWAQTLDGRAAAANGTSRWITGPEARADVHRRRAEADAILVGTGTLLTDDPSLTARTPSGELLVPAGRQPIPVVVGRRAIPQTARVLQHPALRADGLAAPPQIPGDDLAAELSRLRATAARSGRRIDSVFVEGGPALISSLLRARLVDELLIYVAPALLGGPRLAVEDLGIADMSGIRRLDLEETRRLGPDLLLRAHWREKENH